MSNPTQLSYVQVVLRLSWGCDNWKLSKIHKFVDFNEASTLYTLKCKNRFTVRKYLHSTLRMRSAERNK